MATKSGLLKFRIFTIHGVSVLVLTYALHKYRVSINIHLLVLKFINGVFVSLERLCIHTDISEIYSFDLLNTNRASL